MSHRRNLVSTLKAAPIALLFIFLVMAPLTSRLQAQNTGSSVLNGFTPSAMAPGSPAGSYPLSGFDAVDLFDGSLNFRLPLVHVQGRGDAQMTMILPFQQKWSIVETQAQNPSGQGTHPVYTPKFDWWVSAPAYTPGFLASRSDGSQVQVCSSNGAQLFVTTLTRITFTSSDGTEYELHDTLTGGQPKPVDCVTQAAPPRGTVFVTADGSAVTFISDTSISDDILAPAANNGVNYPSGYLFLANGVRYRIDAGKVSAMRDRNGNELTFTYNGGLHQITDSLNRTISLSNGTITFNGVNGNVRTVSVPTSNLATVLRADQTCPTSPTPPCMPAELFPDLNGASTSNPFNPVVTSSVILPGGTLKYQFFYNVYGELARLVLPTGGAIEYDYAAGVTNSGSAGDLGPNGMYRRIIERRVYADGIHLSERETFSQPESFVSGSQISNAGYVDVTHYDPANGNAVIAVERHYFLGNGPGATLFNGGGDLDPTSYNAWKDGKESEVDSGSPTLRRVTNAWTQSSPNWWAGTADLAPSNNPVVSETDTTLLDTNQVSKQIFAYDSYTNRTNTYEYDYGSGLAGTLLRHTHADYVTTSNGISYDTPDSTSMDPATTIHLRNLPLDETVYDGTGAQQSQTSFEYDNYIVDANHAALLGRSGITGIDPTFSTNARGNVTATTRWLNTGGSVTSYAQYDIAGNVVKNIDPLGDTTQIDYSSGFQYAYPTTLTSPIPDPTGTHGSSSSLVTGSNYDFSTGKVVSTTDANGQTTTYEYKDALDRLTRIVSPAVPIGVNTYNPTTVFTYNDSSLNVVTARDKNTGGDGALQTKTVYDGLGRLVQTQLLTDPQGVVMTDTTYDALERKHTVSNPYRSTSDPTYGITTYGYDPLSRVTSLTEPDGSVISTQYPGNQTTVTDEAGKVRRSTTDAAGHLTQVNEGPGGLNYLTTYSYDALDDLTAVHQGAQTRSFVYDSLKRLTSATNPESNTVSYSYDAAGNLHTKTDARGITTTYQYDALKRVFSRGYSDTTPTVSYRYDDASVSNSRGRLTQVNSTVSTTHYTGYDALGRVSGSSQSTAGQAYNFSYGYNLAGDLISETYPSGRVVQTGYNGGDRITSVQSQGGTTYASALTYAPQGAATSMTLGNGLVETTAFNNRLQPTSIAAGTVASFGYSYGTGNNGNVMSQTITAGAFSATQSYGYDGVNRLTSASEGTNWTESYGYDPYGNRTSVSVSSVYLPTYAPAPAISASTNRISDANFSYDNASNLTQAPVAPGGAIQTYAYDAENKLVNFNGGVATYAYDGDGHRVQKTMGSSTTIFVYDVMGKLMAEYSNTAATGSGTKYLTADNLGSTRLMTDASGNVLVRHDYLPFGEEIPSSFGNRGAVAGYGATEDTRQKFTGKERDAESGLDNFGYRYNASAMGRLMTPDPVFISAARLTDPQSLNLYAYVRNKPLSLTDPTGLDFYLSCTSTKDNASTCQQVQNGDQKVWAQGQIVKGQFQAYDIDMNRDGSGLFSDQFGNDYKGTFNQNGVSFSSVANGGASGGGTFIEGSDQTDVNGSGLFSGLQGHFISACGGSCEARGSLTELQPGALATMEGQINQQSGFISAIDLLSGAHSRGTQWKDANGFIHVILNGSHTKNAGITEMHFEGHPTGVDVTQFVLHMVDTVRDANSGAAAAQRNMTLPTGPAQ